MSYTDQFQNNFARDFKPSSKPNGTHMNSYTFRTGMVLSLQEVMSRVPVSSGYAWWDEAEVFQKRIVRFDNVPGSIYAGVSQDDPIRIQEMWKAFFGVVNGDVIISGILENFNGVPKRINGRLDFSEAPGMTSLNQIHQHFEYISERLILPVSITSDILGVLKVSGLQEIAFREDFTINFTKVDGVVSSRVIYLNKVAKIVNEHLSKSKRDILQCQEDLIDADFKDFANM